MKRLSKLERVGLKLAFWFVVLVFCVSACTRQILIGQINFIGWGIAAVFAIILAINVLFEIATME